jgi:glycosyltransferase involved in cell wall biosynthesis
MSAPTVSVIIPNYNYGHYLPQCLDSMLGQTRTDWEVIVVDDGSIDESVTVVQRYVARYPDRFRLLRTDDGPSGTPTAVNKGIRAMRGRYFSWLSSDDASAPEKLERLLDEIERYPRPGLVHSAYRLIDANGNMTGLTEPPEYTGVESFFRLLEGNFINGSTVLVPKSLLDEVGPLLETDADCHELWLVSEYILWLEIALRRDIRVLAEPLHDFRIHSVNGAYNGSQLGPNLVRVVKRRFLRRYGLPFVVSQLETRSNLSRAQIYDRISAILTGDPFPDDILLFGKALQSESPEEIAAISRAAERSQRTRTATYVIEYNLAAGRPIPSRLSHAVAAETPRQKKLVLGALNQAKQSFGEKNYSEAINRLQAVLSFSALPADIELSARFYLAQSLAKAGDLKGAACQLERVLRLEPNHQRAKEAYEMLSTRKGDGIPCSPSPACL